MKKIRIFLVLLLVAATLLGSYACKPSDQEMAASSGAVSQDALTASILSSFVGSADWFFLNLEKDMEFLASTNAVISGNWEAMQPMLAAYQELHPELFLFFVLPDGSYMAASSGPTGKNLSDRAYFPSLMAGNAVVGELVVSKATGLKAAVVAAPVILDGKVAGAVGASVFLEQLNDRITGLLSLPEDMLFFALAQDGLTALNTVSERLLVNPTEMHDPELTRGKDYIIENKRGVVTYSLGNIPRRVMFVTSQVTGWHFAIGTKVQ
jgi:C4-dicarboxylate-specific signal transduction histidine kinase